MEGVQLDLLLFTKSFHSQTAGLLPLNQPIHSFLLCHHLIFDKTKNQLPDQQYAVGGRDTFGAGSNGEKIDCAGIHPDNQFCILPTATAGSLRLYPVLWYSSPNDFQDGNNDPSFRMDYRHEIVFAIPGPPDTVKHLCPLLKPIIWTDKSLPCCGLFPESALWIFWTLLAYAVVKAA